MTPPLGFHHHQVHSFLFTWQALSVGVSITELMHPGDPNCLSKWLFFPELTGDSGIMVVGLSLDERMFKWNLLCNWKYNSLQQLGPFGLAHSNRICLVWFSPPPRNFLSYSLNQALSETSSLLYSYGPSPRSLANQNMRLDIYLCPFQKLVFPERSGYLKCGSWSRSLMGIKLKGGWVITIVKDIKAGVKI